MSTLDRAIVVIHPLLAPITDADVTEALSPANFTATTRTVRFDGAMIPLAQLAEFDWAREAAALSRHFDNAIAPLFRGDHGDIHVFVMMPIPLGVELGRRFGPTRRVLAHQQRHDTKSWRWPSEQETVGIKLHGVPTHLCRAKGDVILRVSCSHLVSEEDALGVVRDPVAELHVEVDSPHEDVLRSEADVMLVAKKVGEALDAVSRFFPNCDTVHLFAAVPPALAIRIGAEINPTIHRSLQTYQFSDSARPRYRRALILGEPAPSALTAEQVETATSTRAAFATSLKELARFWTDAAVVRDLTQVLGLAASELPKVFGRLGAIDRPKTLVGASVSEVREAGGEFRFEPGESAWVFDDRLLAALGARLDGPQVVQAGRLFLLHETLHVERQGVTTATADGIGRLPRVLEEADYLADVWALLYEYAYAKHIGETDADRALEFFRSRLRLMTATFWAFNDGDGPMRAIQVRRLNRYLLWYWQQLALENAATLADVVRILATKPVLETAGPRVYTAQNSVLFDLDPIYFDAVELGVLVDGYRVFRIGARPGAQVGAVLGALRARDETGFLAAFRGLFETATR